MSWSDFMYTKQFGTGIHRPYADFLAEVAMRVDNILANDPTFARWFPSLSARDLVFSYGKKIAVLSLSRSQHRHYPLRVLKTWEQFLQIDEDEFLRHVPGLDLSANRIDRKDLNEHLVSDFNFVDPLSVGFPALFTPTDLERGIESSDVARLILETERAVYKVYLEMQESKDVFLSHKTADKALVREIARTLRAVGLSPWLDEDRMKAGIKLERAIRAGMRNSCAAVFFVTPNFKDEGYLESEIDYALEEKRAKGDRFAIVTLLLSDVDGNFGEVPMMLRPYLYLRVSAHEVVRAIVEALPIRCGDPGWVVQPVATSANPAISDKGTQ